jgi:nitrite reductase (NADH) large subunit
MQAEAPPAAPATPAAPPRRWKCLVCGYVHEGDAPPDECPVCGADSDQFELVNDAPAPAAASGKAVRIVVVGGGIAGVSAIESARQSSPGAEITLVSEEPDLPYYRLNLTRYLAGEINDDALPIHPEAWYAENRIRLLRGAGAAFISPRDALVTLKDGAALPYDKLILACGAHAFVPPFPGATLPGVGTLRTVADAQRILKELHAGARCVVIGGGILGLETAGALAKRGARVTLLEGAGWLLQRQLNETAGTMLARYVSAAGISLRFNAKTAAITGTERAEQVVLDDGTAIPADLVVIATGVRSNNALAGAAGLTVNLGTVVDARLATSAPDVFAAGDVTEHRGVQYGLWDPARHQGAIAGMNAAGVATEFGGIPRANTLKVLGVGLFSVGMVMPEDGVAEVAEECGRGYCRFLFKDGRMAGAIFLGETQLAATAAKAVKSGTDFSAVLAASPTVEAVKERLRATVE